MSALRLTLSCVCLSVMGCGNSHETASDAGSCAADDFTACGGNPVGTWRVSHSCATEDVLLSEPDAPEPCRDTRRAVHWQLSGTAEYDELNRFSVDLVLQMRVVWLLTGDCRAALGEAPFVTREDCAAAEESLSTMHGVTDASCTFEAECRCEYTVQQPWEVDGNYTLEGSTIEHSVLVPLGNELCVQDGEMEQRRLVDGATAVWMRLEPDE